VKLLLIEDDETIAAYLAKGLREAGHVAQIAANGQSGLFIAASENFDALVIDRMLPQVDGITIAKTLRSSGNKTPILFLTALGRIDQRLEGFAAGGDDYLVKPFAFSEFLARTLALARRPPLAQFDTLLKVGGITLDRIKRAVECDGEPSHLLPREFALLDYLMLHAGEVVTRTMLLEQVWDFHFDPQTNIVETHISRLRAKLGACRDQLHTLRGAGYVLRA
jgi:two-component system, OmpR family, response regulator